MRHPGIRVSSIRTHLGLLLILLNAAVFMLVNLFTRPRAISLDLQTNFQVSGRKFLPIDPENSSFLQLSGVVGGTNNSARIIPAKM